MIDIQKFFDEQMAVWPECKERYDALAKAETRQLGDYTLVYNPARAKSAKARVENGKALTEDGKERACFLCKNVLPKEQMTYEVQSLPKRNKYLLAVNPYPITHHHFTIIAEEHTRQTLDGGRLWDMAFFADLLPDYLIFFNGACSGASSPDHMHFQAVPKSAVPVVGWNEDRRIQMGVTRQMPLSIKDSDNKNVLVWTEGSEAFWMVVDRKAHRPSQYADGTCIISPASLEFAGLVPLCRKEDYDNMTISLLNDIMMQCRNLEPMIHVGIMEGQQIRFSAEERTHSLNYIDDDQMKDVMDYGSNRAEALSLSEYWCHQEPFTLEGVTIGKQFHWEKQEDQVFRGHLHVIAREGQLHAINLIPVEEYLKSVISSEMSATNALELLKAHAIISRSWVLRQIGDKEACGNTGNTGVYRTSGITGDSEITKYWDHEDHTLYDVCADDHCQRYQGIVREDTPLVEEAINATRGMVLKDDEGHICDARFSKCCGGKTELFSTCWQDVDMPYLTLVQDPYCSPEFINTLPGGMDAVLSQVLNNYDQQTTDYHDWHVHYTREEISELVNRRYNEVLAEEGMPAVDLGKIQHLKPVKRGASGRIEYLYVEGSKASVTVGKELLIRKLLSNTHLYSSWFDVEETADGFILHGHGWGHGVGLCQIGAAAMALKGFTCEEILSHYYPGAVIAKLY